MGVVAKGIDVSVHNGSNIDYKKVKAAGYTFVMIRAGFGKYISQKDELFETNYKKAKAAGLGVGAYWYSYATSVNDAKAEAAVFCEAIKGKTFEYPVAFDIEDPTQTGFSVSTISTMVDAFCGYMEKAGYYCSLYSYAGFLNGKCNSTVKSRFDVWVAHFDVSKPSYSGNYGMWQYSSTGRVNGISGNVDCNYSYKDYPSIMKTKGVNGFKKSSSSTSSSTKPATSTTPKPAATSSEKLMKFRVNAVGLRYRDKASLSGKIIGVFPNKKIINVVKGWGHTADGIVWYKVKVSGKYYYTASEYLNYISG